MAGRQDEQQPVITRCPPGCAKGSRLFLWQFGVKYSFFPPCESAAVWRIAAGELNPCETAIFNVVLDRPGDMSQRELETVLGAIVGASRSQVFRSAQNLAKCGVIGRKKIGRQWHHAKPGFSWRQATFLAPAGTGVPR